MIKINLLGEVKPANSSSRVWIAGYAASLILLLSVSAFSYFGLSGELTELKENNALLQAQLDNLKKQTKSVADLDKKKKELEDKLKIISILKRSKSGPVHVLDDVNTAIPERSWLTAMSESENLLKIAGLALDNQTIAIFMKDLTASNYVENVDLVEAKNAKHDGLNIKSFVLDTRINYAGKPKATPAAIVVNAAVTNSSSSSLSEGSSSSMNPIAAPLNAAKKAVTAVEAHDQDSALGEGEE